MRLWVHRLRSCGSTAVGSKFWFHLFLFAFAVGKLAASAVAVAPGNTDEPTIILNSISGCSYITLLLFLEMHWREILWPMSSVNAKSVAFTWLAFWALNVVLYVTVAVSVSQTAAVTADVVYSAHNVFLTIFIPHRDVAGVL
jgi:hypothetical protein